MRTTLPEMYLIIENVDWLQMRSTIGGAGEAWAWSKMVLIWCVCV